MLPLRSVQANPQMKARIKGSYSGDSDHSRSQSFWIKRLETVGQSYTFSQKGRVGQGPADQPSFRAGKITANLESPGNSLFNITG